MTDKKINSWQPALQEWADMYNKADREKFNLMLENGKLKKALQEIKEIGETCSFTDNSELLLSRIEHILQKISEVEE